MATKYTQQSNGMWQTKVWDGTYKANGTKHRVSLYSTKSSGDLEKKVNKFKREVEKGQVTVKSDMTFMEYAKTWSTTYKAVRSNNTKKMYSNVIDKHFAPMMGIKLCDTRRTHFQELINEAMQKPRTCQQIALTFKQVIKAAVSDKLLPASAVEDICSGVDLPKYRPGEKRALFPEEKEAIKAADLLPREKAFVYIILGCRLRRGEALALTIFDISLKKSELTVNKALEFGVNDSAIKDTKSINGERTVPMPPYLRAFMQEYILTLQGTNLFTKLDGSPITKSSYDKMWRSIVKKLNAAAGGTDEFPVITGLTAHVFRHNYCTNLCYQVPKISLRKIAELLGDTQKMVMDVYNHVMEEKENVVDAVESATAL